MSVTVVGTAALAAVQALASVVVLYLIGVLLVVWGPLDAKTTAVIANLVKLIFVPSIIFVVVGGDLTAPELQENSFLLMGGLFTVFVGFFCGQLLVPYARAADAFRPWFVMGVAFPNMLALPVVFIEAVCQSDRNLYDEPSVCATAAESRLFIFVLVFPLLEWGLGSCYVRYCQRDIPEESLQHHTEAGNTPSCRTITQSASKPDLDVQVPPLEQGSDLEAQGNPSSDSQDCSSREQFVQDSGLFWLIKKAVLTNPPILAIFGSLVFVFWHPARSLFFGRGAPLLFVASAIKQLSNATPAVMNMVTAGTLGCHIVRLRSFKGILGGHGTGLNIQTVVLLATCRVIVVPSIVLGTLYLCQDFVPDDEWLRRLLYIVPMSPTASAVVSLAHALGQPRAAEHLASASLLQFLLYPLTMMMSMTVGPIIFGV